MMCTCAVLPKDLQPCKACIVTTALARLQTVAERTSSELAREFHPVTVTVRLGWHELTLRPLYRMPVLEEEPTLAAPVEPTPATDTAVIPKGSPFPDDGAGRCACGHHPIIEHNGAGECLQGCSHELCSSAIGEEPVEEG